MTGKNSKIIVNKQEENSDPNLVYDESNVEDIDTRQEDHIYDECRYVLMENPISPPVRCAAPPMPDDPLELHKRARFYRI